MTVNFTTTQQKVVFTDTDGAVTFTATQAPVTFTAAISGPQGDSHVKVVDWGYHRGNDNVTTALDAVGNFAAWEAGGGPAYWNISDGDRVAINDRIDPEKSGIYDYTAGVGMVRSSDADTFDKLNGAVVVGKTFRHHTDLSLVTGPPDYIELLVVFIPATVAAIDVAEWNVDWFVERVSYEKALDYSLSLTTGLYAGLPSTSFIYNSSGPQAGTRFNSWTDLMAAVADARFGGPRSILFEQNETLPSGSWDLTDVTLLGNGFGTLTGVGLFAYLDDGCTFTQDILRVGAGLTVMSASTSPIMSRTGNSSVAIYLSDGAAVAAAPAGHPFGKPGQVADAAPFMSVTTSNSGHAANVLLKASGSTCIWGGADFGFLPIVSAAYGGGSLAIAYDQSGPNTYWNNGILTTSGGSRTVSIYYNDSGPFQDPAAGSISGSGGTYTATIPKSAKFQSYTPADTSKWTGADPTTVAQALDRIAAALGPIA